MRLSEWRERKEGRGSGLHVEPGGGVGEAGGEEDGGADFGELAVSCDLEAEEEGDETPVANPDDHGESHDHHYGEPYAHPPRLPFAGAVHQQVLSFALLRSG